MLRIGATVLLIDVKESLDIVALHFILHILNFFIDKQRVSIFIFSPFPLRAGFTMGVGGLHLGIHLRIHLVSHLDVFVVHAVVCITWLVDGLVVGMTTLVTLARHCISLTIGLELLVESHLLLHIDVLEVEPAVVIMFVVLIVSVVILRHCFCFLIDHSFITAGRIHLVQVQVEIVAFLA